MSYNFQFLQNRGTLLYRKQVPVRLTFFWKTTTKIRLLPTVRYEDWYLSNKSIYRITHLNCRQASKLSSTAQFLSKGSLVSRQQVECISIIALRGFKE